MVDDKQIFVVGLEDFNKKLLESVREADRYVFHGLLDHGEIVAAGSFDMERLLDKARRTLRNFSGSVDAIVGYWDFPTTLMMAILRREFGLRGPTLESVLKCEHKYWARLEQQKVVPDEVPDFAWFDPFDDESDTQLPLAFPFWLKPVKSHSSKFGYRIENRGQYEHALDQIRNGIHYFADPFNVILGYAELPDHIRSIDGSKCIAEEIISRGRQCTLEGFSFQGDVVVYGIVDSIRGPNRSSFERYEYPSSLPGPVKERMCKSAQRVITAVGLDDSPFNIEFFYDQAGDRILLLEVNARISKSHSPLFDKVEGVPHKEVMIDVALGQRPNYPARQGQFRYAAKFMPRLYGDHEHEHVASVPSESRIREIEAIFPGAEIQLHVQEGLKLADSRHRDAYSTELGSIFVGADSRPTLTRMYRSIMDELDLKFTSAHRETA